MKKYYVITGSTSGIGKELVDLYSQNPNNVIFAGYRNEKLINQDKNNVDYFYLDMTERKSIAEAANYIKSRTNHIDTVINVAGSVVAGPVEEIDIDRLRHQFDINTFSHIELVQNLTDILKNGKIINISSMSSFGIFPFISPYCASKRALDIFFNAFAVENHKNIKVISIKPGVIQTPIWKKSVDSNFKYLEESVDYKKELDFIKNNALKNLSKGLKVESVAKYIKKVDNLKNPKSSYTIGLDAKFAEILSHLPQDIITAVVKFGLKARISKNI